MGIHIIQVNTDSGSSVAHAEKEKSRLENLGYHLKKTVQIGLSKFNLVYVSNDARRRTARKVGMLGVNWRFG